MSSPPGHPSPHPTGQPCPPTIARGSNGDGLELDGETPPSSSSLRAGDGPGPDDDDDVATPPRGGGPGGAEVMPPPAPAAPEPATPEPVAEIAAAVAAVERQHGP